VIRRSRLAIVGTALAAIVGLAARTGASAETWAGMSLLTIGGVLLLAAIGAVCRGSHQCPRLLGFAVFGWGYFALARWYSYHQGPMPTVYWLAGAGDIHNDPFDLPPEVRIAHDAWTLVSAVFGSALAGLLFERLSAREPRHADQTLVHYAAASCWRGPACWGLLGFGLVAVVAVFAAEPWHPESWAGAAFLLTWAVIGLAVLGAISARGRWRKAWVGSASFGIGYLILAFGPFATMTLPTDHLLNAVFHPGGPTTARIRIDDDLAGDNESQRICRTLRQPIAVHFPQPTRLRVVLDHIKSAVKASLGKDLVVYAGLETRRPLPLVINTSFVAIDSESIPADDALRHCLGQVGLTHRVQSGYVRIVPDAYQPLPFADDPVMIGGHSLLALLAATFGGVGAVFVAGLRGR
jgi:hypothetical protein